MNDENTHIDMEELTSFIVEKAKEEGFDLTEEIVDLVLDLETDFLASKGLVTEIPDEE